MVNPQHLVTNRTGDVVAWTMSTADLTKSQVWAYDRRRGRLELVSATPTGGPSNGTITYSVAGGISADGRYVVFESDASNLVRGDTNGLTDVFVRDRVKHTTTRVSVDDRGRQLPYKSSYSDISADGSTIAYVTQYEAMLSELRVRPRTSTWTKSIARGWAVATEVALSDNGRVVAFASAVALVPDDHRDGPDCGTDVYLADVATRRLTLISADDVPAANPCRPSGATDYFDWPSLDATGRCVAFRQNASGSTGLVWLRDMRTGAKRLVTPVASSAGGGLSVLTVSADCTKVYYLGPLAGGDPQAGVDGGGCLGGCVYQWSVASGAVIRISPDDPPTDRRTSCAGCDPVQAARRADPSLGLLYAVSDDGRRLALATTGPYDPGDTDSLGDVYLFSTA
jgi:Tol biopolymer transport system component